MVEFLIFKRVGKRKRSSRSPAWPALDQHAAGVRASAASLCDRLFPGTAWDELRRAVSFAAACHDLGKNRRVWQRGAGNRPGNAPVAKTLHGRPPENLNGFRHEFASLIDVLSYPEHLAEFEAFSPEMQDVILQLIAAHHGRARPHFPGRGDADLRTRPGKKNTRPRPSKPENTDPERPAAASACIAAEVPSRFARLQRKYGRWGLAYLESLVRAADALDSRRIEEAPVGDREPGTWPRPAPTFTWSPDGKPPTATVRVRMDPTNPGHFFACCGLLELAHRLWEGAEGWFDGHDFCLRLADPESHADTTADGLLQAIMDAPLTAITAADTPNETSDEGAAEESAQVDRHPPVHLGGRFDLRIDWYLERRPRPVRGTQLKPWAGQQKAYDIAVAMQQLVRGPAFKSLSPDEWLFKAVPTKTSAFSFDAFLSSQAVARDTGFSLDKLGMKQPVRPLLELPAFVGLQRFRPLPLDGQGRFRYGLWRRPAFPVIAAVAATGAIHHAGDAPYQFSFVTRVQDYRMYLPAQPYRGDSR